MLHNQNGATLVSLMIGMLISSIGILGTVTLYKNLLVLGADARQDSTRDGQVATSLLTTQLQIQNAGFGLDSSTAITPHVVAPNSTSVYWRYSEDRGLTHICKGVEEVQDGDDRRLRLVAPRSCDGVTALETLTWDADIQSISYFKGTPDDPLVDAIFDFSISTLDCSPYGIMTSDTHPVLVVGVKTAAEQHIEDASGAAAASREFNFCLTNI